jgi:hypothetical protein
MQQAAFARGHGWKGVWLAGGAYALDCSGGGGAEFAVAVGLEAVGVEGDAIVLLGLKPQDLGGDVLDGVKEFTVAVGEEWGVGAGEFYAELCGGDGCNFAV